MISRKSVLALGVSALLSWSMTSIGASEHHAKSFTFTAIPDQDASLLKQRFDKVAKYLSESLGMNVKYKPVKSYAASITAFKNNQVQLAWFGGLSGVRARLLVPNSEAIAQGQEDPNFVSYFIAHESTKLKPADVLPESLKGLTFTFGSKGSTSGRLMPEFFLKEQLGSPESIFKKVGFSGDHSRTIALVQSGSYQVGVVNYKVWDSMLKAGKIDINKVSVIWKTPGYPDYQWSIRGDFDRQFGEGMKDKVKAALLGMKDPELLNSFPRSGFIEAKNSDYAPILNTAKTIGLID